MNIRYSQSTGRVTIDGKFVAQGWAGNHEGKNNPEMQDIHDVGPLPRGNYTMGQWEAHHDHLGPMVCHLYPDQSNQMFGRDGFFIHGPAMDQSAYGEESKGCIVLPHMEREMVRDLGVYRLEVTE